MLNLEVSKLKIQNSKFIIISILFLAAFFRFYQLPLLPPGLNFDEAGNGVAALDILNGVPQLWWRIGGGKEPFWPYLIALSTMIFGYTPLSLRLPAALIGVLTVAAVYPLMLALFRHHRQAIMIALLTMLGLAVSEWHLHFSRLGFRAILLPLFSTLSFYFFWCSMQSQGSIPSTSSGRSLSRLEQSENRTNIIFSAFFMALAIYSYLAARMLPVVIVLFAVMQWFARRKTDAGQSLQGSTSSQRTTRITHYALRITPYIPLLISLIFFLSPLILYFIFNPADFAARSTTVSIFNPAWHNGNLLDAFWQTLTATLSTFVGLDGDANPLVNLPNQPAVPIILAPFFVLGFLFSIFQIIISVFRSTRLSAPYHFLLAWWVVMLLPALLAPEGAPHHLRLLGTIVPTHAFIALGFITAVNFLLKLLRTTHYALRIATLLPATCYLVLTLQSYTNTFIRWPNRVDFTLPFDLYATRLAADIAQTPDNATYIIPMDIRAAAEARHYTLDYLLASHQLPITSYQLPVTNPLYTYIPVDERNAETLLTQTGQNNDELRIVRWTDDKHRAADEKEIVTFLLETNAQFVGRESFPVYDIETYTLSDSAKVSLPSIDQSINAVFDKKLRVDNVYLPPTAQPGDWLPVAITFAPLAPMEINYKASLRLIDPGGERVTQKDRTLKHNFHQGTSLWPSETVNEYYLLPIPPETPSGDYTVSLVIYHPDTLAPLVSNGVVELPLGTVTIQ